ncbi:MAG: hypothetical protein NTW11_00945 [Candidatus Staskawiczbacteria bacterium]|nr:hypothetical protein [Candidatus Staskawiczbacteria bacterium]
MTTNEFLTIQEFIQKYDVADIRIRRRIRKYRLVDPQKLEGNLSERHDKGVGNIILLKEDFWVKELEISAQETAYAVPLKRSDENDQNRLSGTPEPLKRSEEIEPNRLSATAYAPAPGQVTVDQEFLEILKEDRAEKKDWIKKYESLLVDYKDKDKELVEREKFMHGLIEKIITDARNTKQLLASQINHLQKQLHAPKKNPPFSEAGEESEPEDGNFTETEKSDKSA